MGASILSDYGASHILLRAFEGVMTDTFVLVLFTDSDASNSADPTPTFSPWTDDIPSVTEVPFGVAGAGYVRKVLDLGTPAYVNAAGEITAIPAGIASYTWTTVSGGGAISWVFTGELTHATDKNIMGYAVLKPGAGAGTSAFLDSDIMFAQLFDLPYHPRNSGDTLLLDKITFRLSKGAVS